VDHLTEEINAILPEIVKTIKGFTLDATRKASSGHPGGPMGTALIASVLWTRFLHFDPTDPRWQNRDRFVLSCGHASMLLYSMLHLCGYDLSLSSIQNFRQLHSKTSGHPEVGVTPGVEATTGPLGTGFAAAVGLAVAERFLAARYNRPDLPIFDHNIYILASDGDIMEGITSEAASFAGHHRFSKIICLYDSNRITIDGPTSLTFSEDVTARFQAMGWQTQEIDGQNAAAIASALENARQDQTKPHFILCHTVIGEGSPGTQNTSVCHGAPLDPAEIESTKNNMNWPLEPFHVPQAVSDFFKKLQKKKIEERLLWNKLFHKWHACYPDLARELAEGPAEEPLFRELDRMPLPPKDKVATRSICRDIITVSYDHIPTLLGGSADLAGSVKTEIKSEPHFSPETPGGRKIHFGIRENAMASILNGLALSPPLRAFGGTFLVFSDFMKPGIRLAALMGLPVIYLFSHDSYAVGEDGPTHQPIEHVMNLRAVPNLYVIRPADIKETIGAWKIAWQRKKGPTAIITSRQAVPVLTNSSRDISRGGYILYQTSGRHVPDVLLIATGSEVGLALEAAQKLELEQSRVRVVSLPCWDLFDEQPAEYRAQVISPLIKTRISIEAGITLGWTKYAPHNIGLDQFGRSGPFQDLVKYFNFTADAVTTRIKAFMENDASDH